MSGPVSEDDLLAYVDGALDPDRRGEVEHRASVRRRRRAD